MESTIYQDIATRTGGDIYIGVVGPVRTGKSTFIKRFMDKVVIPNIENVYGRERAIDELPQSAQGRTIMTTEPKFIPNEAVEVTLEDNARFKMRMIDCVGYVVKNAAGYIENNAPRMVSTPWYDYEIPFEQAAEMGTKKVITDHSTIGLVVTTDGSITELDRDEYTDAEERVIKELHDINKPFIIVLNSAFPTSDNAVMIRDELERKYNTPVMAVNCAEMSMNDINGIMERILFEFPLNEIELGLPAWMGSLEQEHWLKSNITNIVESSVKDVHCIRHAKKLVDAVGECEHVSRVLIDNISLGDGNVAMSVQPIDGLFYTLLSETSGLEISSEDKLMSMMIDLGKMKRDYDKIAPALQQVRQKGYGIVSPTIDELALEEPEIVRQGSRYGVRLKASAPSIHMIRADIETEVSPIVGTEKQSEELVHYLLNDFNDEPTKIWESNIFGKSLNELVNEGLHNKLGRMPDDAQFKLQETLQKIINEGSGGLICLIL